MSDTLSFSNVLDALHAQQQQVPVNDRGLEKELDALRQRLQDDPSLENDPQFCTTVAWLVQDWPAHSGAGQVPAMSPLLQAGLHQFATTVPGLENSSLRALMAETATLADRGLVNDIRAVSLQAAALPPAMQTGLMVKAAAEQLTARAGMTSTPTPTVEAPGGESAPQPSNLAADRAENVSPVVSVSADADDGAASATAQPAQQVTAPSPTRRGGFWGNPCFSPDAMAARDTQRMAQIAQNAQEQAAVVARNIEALRYLGRDLLQDIDNTAATHGISVESVIAGTGPGGPFEALSQKFTTMLAQNPEFQAAHEALHLSGRKLNARVSQLDGEAQARGKKTDPTVTNAERVAAQVALELGRIPGLLPGKSILQEIGAVVLRLVEKFRDFFRGQSQDRMRDAGPAPRR